MSLHATHQPPHSMRRDCQAGQGTQADIAFCRKQLYR